MDDRTIRAILNAGAQSWDVMYRDRIYEYAGPTAGFKFNAKTGVASDGAGNTVAVERCEHLEELVRRCDELHRTCASLCRPFNYDN